MAKPDRLWRATNSDGMCIVNAIRRPEKKPDGSFSLGGGGAQLYTGANRPPVGSCEEYVVLPVTDIRVAQSEAARELMDAVMTHYKDKNHQRLSPGERAVLKALDECVKAGVGSDEKTQSPPEMAEVVRELVEWTDDIDSSEKLRSLANAVRDHYPPPFRITGPGVYLAECGREFRILCKDQGLWVGMMGSGQSRVFHDEGVCSEHPYKLTTYLRPLEGS